MRDELDELLFQRYPSMFVQRHWPPDQTSMCWGFACGDGWFALIDSFCAEVQCMFSNEFANPIIITQVKSKCDSLRIYFSGGDERVRAMSNLVRTLSECIDEESGCLRPVT
jgi:hypothetical protein